MLLTPQLLLGQTRAVRWDLHIRGPSWGEAGELRLEGATGRVLLTVDDSAYQTMTKLRIADGRITFFLATGRRRFDGTITDTLMSGTMRDVTGVASTWQAYPLNPGSTRMPVPPRVTVRQLLMGTNNVTVRVPGAWVAAMPATAVLEEEYRGLATVVGVKPLVGNDRSERSRRFTLGFDDAARIAAMAQLRLMTPPFGADPAFRRLFDHDLDLHDVATRSALRYVNRFDLASAGRGLQLLGEIAGEADAAAIREGGWRVWSRMSTDSVSLLGRIDAIRRQEGNVGASLFALIAGYYDAEIWWHDAVHWLLTHAWLETSSGLRSPSQLMASFWGVDSLPLPEIRTTRFGDAAALPIVSAQRIGPHLVRARNASATEWLQGVGMQTVLDAWRPLRWGEVPLVVEIAGQPETVLSPWAQAQARPAAFFGERDAIRIDPGITPFAAVATIMHEWHHLIAAQRRLSGAHPPALVERSTQLQLLDDDPWMAEGFAEWATEETLRPAGASGALLRFGQAEKRLAIADRDAEDPHVFGYRLIRAASKGRTVAALRDSLVANMSDLNAVARLLKLPAPSAQRPAAILHRPANLAVIPGVTFTWDDGAVINLSRRLIIPNKRSEH